MNDPATGFSPFPGNANNLVFYLPNYHKVLQVGVRPTARPLEDP